MNTKKRTAIYKALAITFALLFTVLFLPVGQIHAYALIAKEYTDYSYITIGKSGEVTNTIYTGNTYTIPRAFIGGNKSYSIGEENIAEGGAGQQVGDSDVTIKSSKITVTYGSPTIVEGEYVNGVEVDVTETPDGSGYGTFKANSIGTYTITYSYTYTVGSGDSAKTYTNYYDMKVESSVTSATMELDNNSENVLPDIIDLSLISTTENGVRTFTKEEIPLPLPTIYDEDGEEVENYEILLEEPTEDSEEELPTDCLVVTVNGGVNADNINSGETKYLKMSGDNVVIDTDVFNDQNFNESFSTYTIKYAYYHQGQFIISTTRSFNTRDKYYENYNKNNLTLRTSSTLTTSAQPGVEQTLPGVTVTTNNNVNHSDEEVAVHYAVKVRYRASGSGSYADLDKSIYNADPENKVLNEDGTLIDPTKFTPLQEGTYTFIYTATDFYGNVVASEEGTYVWRNIEDTTDPTPIIYDASERDKDNVPTYENADHKLKTQTKPNGVIVYAVGIDDNLSKSGDSDVDLKREVYSGDTERLFTIENYDEYNLIFNYRASSDLEDFEHNAYQNFIDNNYLIRKALGETSIGSDAEMLTWLKGTEAYLIVVDNANYTHIYNYFTSEINAIDSSITDASSFLNFAKNKANMQKLIDAGFAYVDSDSIFGANQANGGYNTTSYTIRYYAEDAAGNSAYISRSMSFNSTTEDTVPPELSFSTIFQDIYLGEDEVTFSFPTASDEVDSSSRMKVYTYYRFLNNDTPITNLTDADGNKSDKDLDDEGVWGDVVSQANRNENGALFSTEYAGYRTEGNDGYFDITNTEEDSYTIDLSLAPNANKVQIFAFVYDDYGNVGVIGREFAVSNVNDQAKPTFVNVQVDDTNTSFQQGATITLPTINVQDDYVNYMTYNISVSHVNNGTRTSITSPTDSTQNRNANRYSYSVNGGTFTAPFAGTYNVSIELKDSGNNRIVVFTNYETSVRPIVQEPQISTSLTSQTVELDENPVINIPTPKIEYSIDNSIDYDSYINNNYEESHEFSYVLRGVDANGNADDYSVGEGQINSFKPEKVGEYTFKYDVRFTAYNPKVLVYNAGSYTPGSVMGEFDLDYYTLADNEGVRIIIVDENTYRVQYNSKTYTVSQNEGSVTVTPDGGAGADDFNGVIELDNLFTDLRYYNLTSQNYTIIVEDTTAPELEPYDYEVSLSADKVNSAEGATLEIQGIKATDRSGIDYEASSVQVRIEYRTDEGTQTSTYDNLDTVEEKMNGKEIIVKRNGTIYITYTVVDNAGNKTEGKEITIQAGDITAPTVEIEGEEDDFINVSEGYTLSSIQKNDNLFRIDLTKIRIDNGNGAKTPAEIEDENVIVKYELVNNGTTSGDDNDGVIDLVSESENELVYEITEVGEYTFTITVQDEHNNVETREFTFSVHEEETDPNAVYQIVGIILIVISVLVLVGVIVYFVVSKVKLDKELKK